MELYDDNPTIVDIRSEKEEILHERQGEVFAGKASVDNPGMKRFYIESYGCAMNFSDSEIIASILADAGYAPTREIGDSDLILINTCSIRDKAEETVRKRLETYSIFKKKRPGTLVGVLGCMAERLKKKLLEEDKMVDMVVGPDAYRTLPDLIDNANGGQRSVNVLLSREETYAEIAPVRLETNGISAFISIMRGCDNMCSFCVVPFTRGRERSRDPFSIVAEARDLFDKGFKEITLLGQNVDSYKWKAPENLENIDIKAVSFAELLAMVAQISPKLRVRFSTSHPKDITNEVLETMASYDNICKHIHLPIQSGNSRVLEIMNRTYTREWFLERMESINRIIPECAVTSDIIAGFCTETEEEHRDTMSVIEEAKFAMSYMYVYSERPGTLAAKKFKDDVSEETKKRRLAEIITVQRAVSHQHNINDIGKTFEVLVEKESKKNKDEWCGRNSQSKVCIFPKTANVEPGDYVMVKITSCTSAALLGELVAIVS